MDYITRLLSQLLAEYEEGNISCSMLLEAKNSPERWVQFNYDTLNAAYPLNEDPLVTIQELNLPQLSNMEVSDWKPQEYATFVHEAETLDKFSAIITAYLGRY